MNARKDLSPELADLRDRLEGKHGKKYWRSLEELADTEAFQELVRREFPAQADVWPDALSRRRFLTLMGASLALAGVAGCSTRPAASVDIRPYVRAPEEVIPGKPLFYATTMTLGGCGVGLLVESHLGRPTKVEGNPDHPASLGATSPLHQASVLTLYDPDRSQSVRRLGQPSSWDDALDALRGALTKQWYDFGTGVRLLTETVTSPTLAAQIEDFLAYYPGAKWHRYEPLAPDAAHRAAVTAFGGPVNTIYRFYDFDGKKRTADVIVSLDSDFLASGPASLRYTAEFTAGRRLREGPADMNRLYVVEPSVTCTGAKADHRLALRASDVEGFARALAAELGVADAPAAPEMPDNVRTFVRAVAGDLRKHEGKSVVIPGDRQPPAVHLLAHAINDRLKNAGHTVLHTDPVEAHVGDQPRPLAELAEDMDRGQVDVLLILGGNPVYTAPADLRFAERMQKVGFRLHLGLYQDETSRQCHWHLPEAHYLESWGDARAFDGTASLVQPLIEPLYHGRSALEMMSVINGVTSTPAHELVRNHWRQHRPESAAAEDFEDFWQTALHDGLIAHTGLPHRPRTLKGDWHRDIGSPSGSFGGGGTELVFQEDPTLYDGRFANNGWLQELPKPLTRLTWDNAALMSPATADRLKIGHGSYGHGGEHGGYDQPVVELRLGDRTLRAAAWVLPGHADDSVTVHLGHGRTDAGKVGSGVGFNAYPMRTTRQPWFTPGLSVGKTGDTHLIACVQAHHLMENREVVRAGTLKLYRDKPDFAADKERERTAEETQRARRPLTMYNPRPH